MSRLEELLQTLCPDGVEYKKLGEIGTFFGGLTGKTKQDFQHGNSKFITYMNVYKNPAVDIEAKDFVSIGADERQNTVEYGDILFTGSSETPEECGISSVMVKHPDEPFYMNSFTIGFRLADPSPLIPEFSKHLFRSAELRKQINKTANGVTRFNVSKVKLAGVVIPLPPLPVQEEIVRILDTFSDVVAELEQKLEAEQAARVRQYEHYRNELLSFDSKSKIMENLLGDFCPDGVEYKKLGDYAPPTRGVRVVKSQLSSEGRFPVYQNSMTPLGFFEDTNCPAETAFLISAGAAGEVGYSDVDFWAADDCFYFTCPDQLLSRFLYHFLKSQQDFLLSRVRRASVPRLARSVVEGIKIPIPSLPMQEKIVSILDRFDTLVNDLKSGLPAEIVLRRKQYEYYRDKLLTFTRRA